MLRLPLLLLLAMCAGCDDGRRPPLAASNVEITRPMPGRQMSAGFLTLTNNTDSAIRISRISSEQFASVEIHETQLIDGISKMRKLAQLSIPARSSVSLERSGKHLMLLRPVDDDDSVALKFLDDDTLLLAIDVAWSTQ